MKTANHLPRRNTLSVVLIALLAPAAAMAAVGPSTTATPYLTPIDSSVEFTSVLGVGDTVKRKNKGNESYRMSGIPDGMGAFDNGDGTITVLVAHELRASLGVVRTHGAKGAFVSRWQVRKSDLKVLNGDDLINTVKLWNDSAYVATPAVAFNRFCSADLAETSAFFNSSTGKGFNEGRIFLNGEDLTSFIRLRSVFHFVSSFKVI